MKALKRIINLRMQLLWWSSKCPILYIVTYFNLPFSLDLASLSFADFSQIAPRYPLQTLVCQAFLENWIQTMFSKTLVVCAGMIAWKDAIWCRRRHCTEHCPSSLEVKAYSKCGLKMRARLKLISSLHILKCFAFGCRLFFGPNFDRTPEFTDLNTNLVLPPSAGHFPPYILNSKSWPTSFHCRALVIKIKPIFK